jgi:hypothetical protein
VLGAGVGRLIAAALLATGLTAAHTVAARAATSSPTLVSTLTPAMPGSEPTRIVSDPPAISGDGRYVAYAGTMQGVPGTVEIEGIGGISVPSAEGLFVGDTATGTTRLIEPRVNSGFGVIALSADGTLVAYDAVDPSGYAPGASRRVKIVDQRTGVPEYVPSPPSGCGGPCTGDQYFVAMSDSGREILLEVAGSPATLFVYDRPSADFTRVLTPQPLLGGEGRSFDLSGDGRTVAGALRPDVSQPPALFAFDVISETPRLFLDRNGAGVDLNGDGTQAAYSVWGGGGIAVTDTRTGETEQVSTEHAVPTLSSSGRFVAWHSRVVDEYGCEPLRLHLLDRSTGSVTLADGSVSPGSGCDSYRTYNEPSVSFSAGEGHLVFRSAHDDVVPGVRPQRHCAGDRQYFYCWYDNYAYKVSL